MFPMVALTSRGSTKAQCQKHADQIDDKCFVVAISLTCTIVAGMFDRPVGTPKVIVEDEIVVSPDLASVSEEKGARVEIEVGAIARPRVPTKPDKDLCEARFFL